jgi:DNA-binding IclR family transcriptional regulator
MEIRRTGVAYDREEHTLGICAIGMALRALDGSWYAVSVPLPAQRFYGQEARLVDALMATVERIIAQQVDEDAASSM